MKSFRIVVLLIPFILENMFFYRVNALFSSCLTIEDYIKYYYPRISDCHDVITFNSKYDKNFNVLDVARIAEGAYGAIYYCKFHKKEQERSVAMKNIRLRKDMNNLRHLQKTIDNEIIAMDQINLLDNPFLPVFLGCLYDNNKNIRYEEHIYIITEALDDTIGNIVEGKPKKKDLIDIVLSPQLDKVIKSLYQVALGLKSLHDIGVGHFDIKPANIMVNEKFQMSKLIDLGFTTYVDEKLYDKFRVEKKLTSKLTLNLNLKGTPGFINLSMGDNRILTLTDDLYAFGKTAKIMLDAQLKLINFKKEEYNDQIDELVKLIKDLELNKPKIFKNINVIVDKLNEILNSILIKNANKMLEDYLNDKADLKTAMAPQIKDITKTKTFKDFLGILAATNNKEINNFP